MANRLSTWLQRLVCAKKGNLNSFDEPYGVMARLLRDHRVTGILDVGASNGHISQRLLRKFPEATSYAFEPNPLYRETLTRLSSDDARIQPQFYALSDEEREVELQLTTSPGSTSLFTPATRLQQMYPEATQVQGVEKVKAVTIDGWAASQDNPAIQVIKFDIQGGELAAMRGATKQLQNSALLVYTEILFNVLYDGGAIYSQLDQYLREYGFVLYDIYKPKYNDNGLLMWGNAIFLHAGRVGV